MPEAGGSRRPVQGGVRARARLATAGPADRPGGRGSALGRGLRRAHLRRRRQDVLGQRPAGAGAAPPRQVTPWGSSILPTIRRPLLPSGGPAAAEAKAALASEMAAEVLRARGARSRRDDRPRATADVYRIRPHELHGHRRDVAARSWLPAAPPPLGRSQAPSRSVLAGRRRGPRGPPRRAPRLSPPRPRRESRRQGTRSWSIRRGALYGTVSRRNGG